MRSLASVEMPRRSNASSSGRGSQGNSLEGSHRPPGLQLLSRPMLSFTGTSLSAPSSVHGGDPHLKLTFGQRVQSPSLHRALAECMQAVLQEAGVELRQGEASSSQVHTAVTDGSKGLAAQPSAANPGTRRRSLSLLSPPHGGPPRSPVSCELLGFLWGFFHHLGHVHILQQHPADISQD